MVTKDLIAGLRISVVIHGTVRDLPNQDGVDPYKIPKEVGIYQEIPSPRPDLTTKSIVERIIENRRKYEERNQKKQAKELKQMQHH